MIAPRIDWPAIAGDVAHALLGEPSSATRRELRYGRKGSLSVDIECGRWRDHEAGEGGGVLALARISHQGGRHGIRIHGKGS